MANAYFLDSSTLVKRYLPEIATTWILSITDLATVYSLAISQITWVEVLSAFSRRQREGSLSFDEVNEKADKFRDDLENLYQVMEIDSNLIERAGELVIQYPLRAYDAVQLASARLTHEERK